MTGAPVLVLAGHDARRRQARTTLLAGEDLTIQEASSGQQTLELASRQPDAVLIDLDLRDPDGIEVHRRLKDDPKFSSPVIVSVSAPTPRLRKAALELRADAYLQEPVDPRVFAATVRSQVRLGQAERERAALSARLRNAQAEIEQFAAQICHDVEEPLRAMNMFVQLVEQRGLNEPERAYFEHVEASTSRVRYLLRGFLSYAQAGAGRLAHFGRIDLRAAAGAAAQSLRKQSEEKGAVIRLEEQWPTVWGDFGQLQQVFEHLIRNAIDYHGPDSATITMGAHEQGSDWVISVSDDGPGIAPDFHSTIFLPFKRLHGREIAGSGMGLAISKRIVEAHGGRMWVESRPGAGARFFFSVPALDSEERPA